MFPYREDTDVDLLIGCNCPQAIKPREVILGKGDYSHAIRTFVVGPVTPAKPEEGEEDDGSTCNRTRQYTLAVLGIFAEIHSTHPISAYIFLFSSTLGLSTWFTDALFGVHITGISGWNL